jgi:transmembrane sensor
VTKIKEEWRWMTEKFAGTIRAEDELLLVKWISESDQHQKMYEEALKIWQNSKTKLHHDNPSTELEWLKIKQRIEREEKKFIKLNPSFWTRIAAFLLLVALIGLYFFQQKGTEEVASTTVIAAKEEVVTLYLPDSSKVWLNLGGRISYQKDFRGDERAIELYGEAYFEVRHDSIPFSVKTAQATVKVLGTSFNVKDEDSVTVVTVAQGKVGLTNNVSSRSVELTIGEVGVVDRKSIKEKKNTDLRFASWRKQHNPSYLLEAENPTAYIANKNIWKKNQLNLSVVEGSITNTATLAAYKNIVLKITYIRPSGKVAVVRTTITDTIYPEQKLSYRKNVLDIFNKAQKIDVEVERAEVIKF